MRDLSACNSVINNGNAGGNGKSAILPFPLPALLSSIPFLPSHSLSFFHPLLHLAPLSYIFSQPQAR